MFHSSSVKHNTHAHRPELARSSRRMPTQLRDNIFKQLRWRVVYGIAHRGQNDYFKKVLHRHSLSANGAVVHGGAAAQQKCSLLALHNIWMLNLYLRLHLFYRK